MIASDGNNPEFLGAHNPDARLAVQFYSRPLIQEFKSEQAQRPIYENVDFIKIFTPGEPGKLNTIDTIAREEHKARFPIQWAAYKNRPDSDTRYIGTPITEWPRISPAQAEELKAIKFYTVETVANASDSQLQGIGMIAGQSAFTFRDDAKRFLMVADAASKLSDADKKAKEADDKLASAKEEILTLQQKHAQDMEEMREQMKELMANVTAVTSEARKPGRPPKEAS